MLQINNNILHYEIIFGIMVAWYDKINLKFDIIKDLV